MSLPEEPADTEPAVVLNAVGGAYDKVFAYDACDSADPWKLYDPDDPTASDLRLLPQRPNRQRSLPLSVSPGNLNEEFGGEKKPLRS